jgi:Ca2+-binding EF-hand superfamily protein
MIGIAKRELNAAFRMFDVDNSGYLEKNEFGQLIKRIAMAFHVEEPTFTDIDNLVTALDENGDGKIAKAEFDKLIIQIVEIIKEERQITHPKPE